MFILMLIIDILSVIMLSGFIFSVNMLSNYCNVEFLYEEATMQNVMAPYWGLSDISEVEVGWNQHTTDA